jgi:hypothetical protein
MTITLNGTTGISNDGGYTGDGILFADTTPSNTLVTTTGGNVGIGTASPGAKLEVAAGRAKFVGNSDQYNIEVKYNSATNGGWVGSPAADVLAFYRGAGGAESGRFDSSGNLLVGTTTTPVGNRVNGHYFYANGGYNSRTVASNRDWGISVTSGSVINFYSDNGSAAVFSGSISVNGSSTAFNTSSDYRLKENVQPMVGALARISALKPVTYKWLTDGRDGEGFIAHELAEVVPDAVVGEKDAVDAEGNPQYQGIDTSFLVATLTAAIQELKAIVDAQGAEIAALKGAQ